MDKEMYEFTIRTQFKQLFELGDKLSELEYKNEELQEENKRLNNKIREYEINTIPTLEHNIDVLVDSEDRLNNIINELEKSWKEEIIRFNKFIQEDSSLVEINNIRKMLIQEREKDLYKLQELKRS